MVTPALSRPAKWSESRRMKTSLTYAAAMAIAGAVLTLLLFFAGFHDSVEKLKLAQWVGMGGGLAIGVVCLALAMRDRRAAYPADRDWGYGPALGTGVLTGLFASLFGLITAYVYFTILNPGFSEVVFQAQALAMEEKGMSAAQIEKIEPILRKWMSPVAMTILQGLSGFVWSTVLSLIVAIFLRRRIEIGGGGEAPPMMG